MPLLKSVKIQRYRANLLQWGEGSQQRGVLTTCNYEARKFGLHSAMPTAQAIKKCPNLILVPVNMPLYKQVSAQIHQIFQRLHFYHLSHFP